MTCFGKLTWPTWILGLFLCAIFLPGAAFAQDENRAGLVVVHDDGRQAKQCVSFDEPEISGLQVLERSGLDLNYDAGNALGAAICRIDAEGCSFPEDDCFCQCLEPPCRYWSYWYRSGGEWIYASIGASDRQIRNGDVEAWVWSEGTINSNADRRPPDDAVFDNICLPPTATPTFAATATETAMPTETPLPTAESATATPTMTATPTHTSTSEPTPTGTTTPTVTPTGIPLPRINQFGGDRTRIDFGESTTLFWDVSGADSVVLYTAEGQEPLPAQGSKTVSPERQTSYSLIAQNAGGNVGAEVVIDVNPVFWTPTPVDAADAAAPLPVVTDTPTPVPTETPLPTPSETPTEIPTETPTVIPTVIPTERPTDTPVPTETPTLVPASIPTSSSTPLPEAVSVDGGSQADSNMAGGAGQVVVIATPAANQGDQLQRLMLFGGFVFVIGVPLLFAGIWLLVYSLWKKEIRFTTEIHHRGTEMAQRPQRKKLKKSVCLSGLCVSSVVNRKRLYV
jgi:hypothetical protein